MVAADLICHQERWHCVCNVCVNSDLDGTDQLYQGPYCNVALWIMLPKWGAGEEYHSDPHLHRPDIYSLPYPISNVE